MMSPVGMPAIAAGLPQLLPIDGVLEVGHNRDGHRRRNTRSASEAYWQFVPAVDLLAKLSHVSRSDTFYLSAQARPVAQEAPKPTDLCNWKAQVMPLGG